MASSGITDGCYNFGAVRALSDTDMVKDTDCRAGGTAGSNIGGEINGCGNSGTVSAECSSSYLFSSAPNPNVGAFARAGGIVGWNNSKAYDSDNIGNVTAKSSVTGLFDWTIYGYPGPYAEISCGGVAGFNDASGIVKNCSNKGPVNGETLPQTVFPLWSVGYVRIGGRSGFSGGWIEDCSNTGNVSVDSRNCMNMGGAGGIAGEMGGAAPVIQNCYNTGAVDANAHGDQLYYLSAGGIAGDVESGAIRNCYSTGGIAAYSPDSVYTPDVGGIVGYRGAGILEHCYWFEGAPHVVNGLPQIKIGAADPSGTMAFRANDDIEDGLPFIVMGVETANLMDALNAFAIHEGNLNEWAIVETVNSGLPIFMKDVPPVPPMPSGGFPWVLLFAAAAFLIILLDDDDEEEKKKP
jgi:hypothetical protein